MSGLFRARWSADIHREWMTAVSERRGIAIEQLTGRREAMDLAVPDGIVWGYEDLIAGLSLPDPSDRHVLAAAIRCGADAIVTFNKKDFPDHAISKFGLRACLPDDFILDIEESDPGVLIEPARNDLAHYQNPPLTIDEYIHDLYNCKAPKTAIYLTRARVILTPKSVRVPPSEAQITLFVTTHPVWAGRGLAAWAAGSARASRMAVRAPRPFRRPVSTIEQRAA
jgi:hypothetical protein